VPRTAVSILAGMTSRTKRIGIAGPLDRVETLIKARLTEFVSG
jgi:uncharacterized protein YggU (UPF0235/DUF167 family)